MKFERILRRIFPSTSLLTYNPVFRTLANLPDLPLHAYFPEFRKLPPNHMRLRVGVANRIFNNQSMFIGSPGWWLCAFGQGWCNLNSTVMDIGSGCGRQAHYLRDLNFHGIRFTGKYIGVDIDREMLQWCRDHFDSERFSFIESTDPSKCYNREKEVDAPFRVPVEDVTVDLVFSGSLFTHLLEKEAVNYLRESFRVLRPGGVIAHSTFCIDHPPPTFGDRHTFSHRMGEAHVESLIQPETAVAYTEEFLFREARNAGFADPQMLIGQEDWQPVLFARKPE